MGKFPVAGASMKKHTGGALSVSSTGGAHLLENAAPGVPWDDILGKFRIKIVYHYSSYEKRV